MPCVYVWEFDWDGTAHALSGPSWAGGDLSPVPAPGQRREQTSGDGPAPVTDSDHTETRGSTHHMSTLRCYVRYSAVWDVNEETRRLSVKIQFCFGRVPIHSWTWQIFFIINHMLARTQPAQLIAQRMFALWCEFEFWIEIGKTGSGYLNEKGEAIDYSKKVCQTQPTISPLSPGINKGGLGSCRCQREGGWLRWDQLTPPILAFHPFRKLSSNSFFV